MVKKCKKNRRNNSKIAVFVKKMKFFLMENRNCLIVCLCVSVSLSLSLSITYYIPFIVA